MFVKRIALFGKSAKNQNYCAAGIDLETKRYIRPISDIKDCNEAVRRIDYVDSNGKEFNDFDVVDIPFKNKLPNNPYQPENLIYDERYHWEKVGTLTLGKMIRLHPLDNRQYLFYNYDRSVEPNFVASQPYRESLLFTQIKDIVVKVEIYKNYPKFYADFTYNGRRYYRFSVGDINTRNLFWNQNAGEYNYKDKAVVILSLTNPFAYGNSQPKCYKMLAQVF